MAKRQMIWRGISAVMLLWGSTFISGTPITRMDIYDAADNHLLFLTFEYGVAGVCTKRNVFSSDSTFLYSTTLLPGSATEPVKEMSVDYLDNPMYTTTVNPPSKEETKFSTVDQFGLSQFGSPLSYTETAPNTFEVSQNKTTLCQEQYEYNTDGELSRIKVIDKNGVEKWYALVNQDGAASRPGNFRPFKRLQVSVNRGVIRLQCKCVMERFISVELLTPLGQRVRYVIQNKVSKGNHRLTAHTGDFLASGAYIMRVTINNTAVLTRMFVVQK